MHKNYQRNKITKGANRKNTIKGLYISVADVPIELSILRAIPGHDHRMMDDFVCFKFLLIRSTENMKLLE